MSAPVSARGLVVVAIEDAPEYPEWSRAAQETGIAEPRFVPWSAVLNSEAEFHAGEIVIVERLYPRITGNPVGGQRARYTEFQAALEQMDAAVTKAGAMLATAVEPTLLALDRTKRDDFLRERGVPLLATSDISEVRSNILRPRFAGSDDWMIDAWRTQLFRHRTRTGFEVRRAPGEGGGTRGEQAEVAAILAEDGIHAVAGLHRVYLTDSFYDIRFEVLDGKATHAAGVVREQVVAREWYGGRRREFDVFLKRFGAERWERVVALAERTATFFPGVRSLGVDLTMDNHSAEYVFDVDPFGAFLPGLVGGMPNPGGESDTSGEQRHAGEKNAADEPISVRGAVLRSLSAA